MRPVLRRTIRETSEELLNHERVYRGLPEEARIRFVRTLRSAPEVAVDEVAAGLGVPRRTAFRWWKVYQERGLTGLINMDMGRPVGSRKAQTVQKTAASEGSPSSADLLALMNGMPVELGTLAGINGLRDRLLVMMPDVDRISMSVNTFCDLEHPQTYRPNLAISQRIDRSNRLDEGVDVRSGASVATPSEGMLEEMRAGGFPFERYHPPVGFDIWYAGTADLGAVVLWREIEKSPISSETIALMETLRPFVVYVFSNLVTRHAYLNPSDRIFYSSLREMARTAKLTASEQRIISYRLLGYSYKRIAEEIGRTEGVVKKHVSVVHRKTGTQGHSELFAKYFTPRLLGGE